MSDHLCHGGCEYMMNSDAQSSDTFSCVANIRQFLNVWLLVAASQSSLNNWNYECGGCCLSGLMELARTSVSTFARLGKVQQRRLVGRKNSREGQPDSKQKIIFSSRMEFSIMTKYLYIVECLTMSSEVFMITVLAATIWDCRRLVFSPVRSWSVILNKNCLHSQVEVPRSA